MSDLQHQIQDIDFPLGFHFSGKKIHSLSVVENMLKKSDSRNQCIVDSFDGHRSTETMAAWRVHQSDFSQLQFLSAQLHPVQ